VDIIHRSVPSVKFVAVIKSAHHHTSFHGTAQRSRRDVDERWTINRPALQPVESVNHWLLSFHSLYTSTLYTVPRNIILHSRQTVSQK